VHPIFGKGRGIYTKIKTNHKNFSLEKKKEKNKK